MKRLALPLALIASSVLLSGCIIVTPRHGGYRDGYGHYRGHGAVYVQGERS